MTATAAATATATDRVALRWLGTAAFQLRHGGEELVLDPFLSRGPGAEPVIRTRPEDLARASLVVVSHGHFDHVMDAPAVARASGARVVAPRGACAALVRDGVPQDRLLAAEDHPELAFGGGRLRLVPTRHIRFDARMVARTTARVLRAGLARTLLGLAWRHPIGGNFEVLLELGRERVLFSGSGGGDFDALARLRPTTFLLPFAGRSDVVDYYLARLRKLRPRTVVLHHFDDFYPGFAERYPIEALQARMAAELPEVRVVVPEPERWLELEASAI